MNIKNKIIIVTLISIILIFKLPIYSKAFSVDSIFDAGKNFILAGSDSNATGIQDEELKDISDTVSSVLLTIALAVTFISIAVMGVNFAIQTVDEKAKIKESMIPWIIGIFVSFGAYGIWKLVMQIFYSMNL